MRRSRHAGCCALFSLLGSITLPITTVPGSAEPTEDHSWRTLRRWDPPPWREYKEAVCWSLSKLLWQGWLTQEGARQQWFLQDWCWQPQELVSHHQPPDNAAASQAANQCQATCSTFPWSWGGTDPLSRKHQLHSPRHTKTCRGHPSAHTVGSKGHQRAQWILPRAALSQGDEHISMSAPCKQWPGWLPASALKRKQGTLLWTLALL